MIYTIMAATFIVAAIVIVTVIGHALVDEAVGWILVTLALICAFGAGAFVTKAIGL